MMISPSKIKVFRFDVFSNVFEVNKELEKFTENKKFIHSISTEINDVFLFVTVLYQDAEFQ